MCVSQPKIAKNTKTSYYGGSRSFKVIDVNITGKRVDRQCIALISSRSVPKTTGLQPFVRVTAE